MSKNSRLKKTMLGKKLKQSRRIPLLAVLRTHRKIEYNRFQRDWRRSKMRLKVD
ncbi:MAG: 50S ribosomal protein L39e [Candidatus Micrarchaeia archaeon]